MNTLRIISVSILYLTILMNLPVSGQSTAENLEKAKKALQTGDYLESRKLLRPLLTDVSPINGEQILYFFETFLQRGEYEEGLAEIENQLSTSPKNPFLLHTKARFLVLKGQYEEAKHYFGEALELRNDFLRNLLEIGELLEQTGHKREALRFYNQIGLIYQQNKPRTATQLAIVARAFAKLEDFHQANQIHNTAHQLDPQNIQNLFWWASLFLEKYNNADAKRTFEEALAINQQNAALYVGYARSTESFSQMETLSQKALEVNPNSVDALNMLAEIHIIDANYSKARDILNRVLKINPAGISSLAHLASIQHLQGETAQFLQTEQKVAKINPFSGDFYMILAENSTKRFRYKDAVEFCNKALSRDRRLWKAYALLGSNLLRIGKTKEARVALERGFKGDPFNLCARNTLELIDEYKNFTRHESEHFTLLIHQSESDVLAGPILSFAEECFDSLSTRYAYLPQTKIHLEAYNDHDDFAVRISGLPGIGLLGVCFGDVLAIDTPRAQADGQYNWAQVLWHEIAHVMALGLSNNKVPRWFTEGLSVYEEKRARPQWARKMELELYYALDQGLLLSLADINKGFTRPQFPEQVILTYYQSASWIEILTQRFGFETITRILQEFSLGKNTEEAFQTVLGTELDDIELLLHTDLQAKRDQYADILKDLPPLFHSHQQHKAPLKTSQKMTENPFFKNLQTGFNLLEEEKLNKAEHHFLTAIDIFPYYSKSGNPYEGLAEIYRRTGEKNKLVDILATYLNITEYGAKEAKELGGLFEEIPDPNKAELFYKQSLQVDPYDPDIHNRLAELYRKRQNYTLETIERQAILALEPMDKSTAQYLLAQSLYNDGKKSKAKKEVLKALDLAPGYRDAQKLLLQCVESQN